MWWRSTEMEVVMESGEFALTRVLELCCMRAFVCMRVCSVHACIYVLEIVASAARTRYPRVRKAGSVREPVLAIGLALRYTFLIAMMALLHRIALFSSFFVTQTLALSRPRFAGTRLSTLRKVRSSVSLRMVRRVFRNV